MEIVKLAGNHRVGVVNTRARAVRSRTRARPRPAARSAAGFSNIANLRKETVIKYSRYLRAPPPPSEAYQANGGRNQQAQGGEGWGTAKTSTSPVPTPLQWPLTTAGRCHNRRRPSHTRRRPGATGRGELGGETAVIDVKSVGRAGGGSRRCHRRARRSAASFPLNATDQPKRGCAAVEG